MLGGPILQFTFERTDLFAQGRGWIKIKEGIPDRLPYQIGGVDSIRLARAAIADQLASTGQADPFSHQPRFAHPGFCRHPDDLSVSVQDRLYFFPEQCHFALASDHRERIRRFLQANGTLMFHAQHGKYRQQDRSCPSSIMGGRASTLNSSTMSLRRRPEIKISPGAELVIKRAARLTSSPRALYARRVLPATGADAHHALGNSNL